MICPFDSVFPSLLWHFITCQDEIFPFNINRHQIWSCHAKLIVPRSKILIPMLQIWMETVACQIYRQLTLLWYRLSFWSDMLNMCLTKVHITSPRCIFTKIPNVCWKTLPFFKDVFPLDLLWLALPCCKVLVLDQNFWSPFYSSLMAILVHFLRAGWKARHQRMDSHPHPLKRAKKPFKRDF